MYNALGNMDSTYFQEPIKVTISFVGLYFGFLGLQSGSKFYVYSKMSADKDKEKVSFAKVKYGSTDRVAVMGDRTVGNLVEQSIPFLTSLWLHAVFVSPVSAAKLGWTYLAFRSIYPFVFYAGMPYLLVSTLPGYTIIGMLLAPLMPMFSK